MGRFEKVGKVEDLTVEKFELKGRRELGQRQFDDGQAGPAPCS